MYYSLLIFLFALVYLILCRRNIYWALYVLLAALPAYGVRFSLVGIPMTLLELMILILFPVWFIKSVFNPHLRPKSKFAGPAFLVLFFATLAMFLSPDLVRAAGIWKAYFLEAFLFFVAFSGIVKTKKEIQGVVFALGFSALYISLFAILQKVTNGWLVPEDYWLRGEGPRVTSFYSYPNAIGLFVAPIVMLHLGYFYYLVSNFKSLTFRSNKLIIGNWAWDVGSWWRILQVVFSLAVVISGVLAIWFARSDGAIIGLVAGLIVFGLFFKKTRIAVFVLLFFCFLVILFSGLPAGLEQKLTFADWSGQARLSMWSETWQMLGDHWLLGVGLAGYQTALAPYHQAKYLEIFLFPHNFILNFWVELGLGGLLAFLYLIGKFFYSGFKIRDPRFKIYVAGLIAVMVVTLVHGLVDVPYFKNDLAILWWVWFGLMSALRLS